MRRFLLVFSIFFLNIQDLILIIDVFRKESKLPHGYCFDASPSALSPQSSWLGVLDLWEDLVNTARTELSLTWMKAERRSRDRWPEGGGYMVGRDRSRFAVVESSPNALFNVTPLSSKIRRWHKYICPTSLFTSLVWILEKRHATRVHFSLPVRFSSTLVRRWETWDSNCKTFFNT